MYVRNPISWACGRVVASFAIAREPLPGIGLHRAAGIALRSLCISAWVLYPALVFTIAAMMWLAFLLAGAFPPIFLGGLVASMLVLFLLVLLVTAVAVATNRVDRRWRTEPADARSAAVIAGVAWLIPAFIFGRWHLDAIAGPHHWTVHLLAIAYVPVLPALATIGLVLFWQPLATPSSP